MMMLAVAAAPALALEVQDGKEENSCVICHNDIDQDFQASVHSEYGVTCVGCHGGDPKQIEWEQAMSPAAGFKGKFTAVEKLNLCSKCHSDDAKMRQFGIPIDQYQRYKSSKHGIALFEKGNQDVAVCTNCHGVHEVVKVKDARSHVYSLNVPETCGKCHANKSLMTKHDVKATVLEDYSKGVHGHGLMFEKNTGLPNCATCHGNHGAAPPGVDEVVNVCGQCHGTVKDNFQKSVHSLKLKMKCIDCHDNHNNEHPTKELYNDPKKGCMRCHPEDSKEYDTIKQQIVLKLNTAEEAIKEAEESIKKASEEGLYIDTQEALLKEAKSSLTQFGPVQHSVSDAEIKKVLDDAISKADNIENDISIMYDGLTTRKVFAGAIAAFIMFFLFVFYLKWKQLKRAYDRSIGKR